MAEDNGAEGATGDVRSVMLGVLALLIADRDERIEGTPPRRSDHVLADAGFNAAEIASLTGRNPEAVRSSLRRRERNAKKGSKGS